MQCSDGAKFTNTEVFKVVLLFHRAGCILRSISLAKEEKIRLGIARELLNIGMSELSSRFFGANGLKKELEAIFEDWEQDRKHPGEGVYTG